MQKDEKLIEVSLEAIRSRLQDVKTSIQSFLAKLEHEQMNWPSFLDNFAVLSGQVNTLTKLLKGERTPVLRNLVVLPLKVQQELDVDIQKTTEGRVHAVNHEVVPDYLRTKYEPEVEQQEQSQAAKASQYSPDVVHKHVSNLNEQLSSLINMINTAKEEWQGEGGAGQNKIPIKNPDLNTLVSAVTFGKGLRPPSGHSSKGSSQSRSGHPSNKVPSSMKTDMKQQATSSSHPYGSRPPSKGTP